MTASVNHLPNPPQDLASGACISVITPACRLPPCQRIGILIPYSLFAFVLFIQRNVEKVVSVCGTVCYKLSWRQKIFQTVHFDVVSLKLLLVMFHLICPCIPDLSFLITILYLQCLSYNFIMWIASVGGEKLGRISGFSSGNELTLRFGLVGLKPSVHCPCTYQGLH